MWYHQYQIAPLLPKKVLSKKLFYIPLKHNSFNVVVASFIRVMRTQSACENIKWCSKHIFLPNFFLFQVELFNIKDIGNTNNHFLLLNCHPLPNKSFLCNIIYTLLNAFYARYVTSNWLIWVTIPQVRFEIHLFI